MTDIKARRVSIEHRGYAERTGPWIESNIVRDDPNGTHMLVPVEVWERVIETFRQTRDEVPRIADEAARICDHILAEIGGEDE